MTDYAPPTEGVNTPPESKPQHGYGDDSDCTCGRNFLTVRGLREHLTKARSHHPNCYQCTGVPHDLPATLCDCRLLRAIDADCDGGVR